MVSKVYAALSWALAAFGTLHLASTFRLYEVVTMQALWFFSGGLLMVFGASLNLLNREYGDGAHGLRVATIVGNVVLAGVALAGGIISRASALQLAIVLGLYTMVTALSATRRALRPVSQLVRSN